MQNIAQPNTAHAYDLTRFSATEEFQPLKVVANKEFAKQKRRNTLRWVERVIACALVLALMVSVLRSRAHITELSDNITALQNQLVEEKSIYDQLNYQLESDATLTKIEEYVSRQLGMVKTDKSQVTYVSLAEENRVERADSGLRRYWNTLVEKVEELLAYIGW